MGNDPVRWREIHVQRGGPVPRWVGRLLTVFAVVFLGDSLLDLGRPALLELAEAGYGGPTVAGGRMAREHLRQFLIDPAVVAAMVWVVGLAATTASGIPAEREAETWTSLASTPLSGREILLGKALGAVRRWRAAALISLSLWTVGLVLGSIHPLGYALVVATFAAQTAFSLALGSFLSTRARTATRAAVLVVVVLLVLNLGHLPWEWLGRVYESVPYRLFASMPNALAVAPIGWDEVEGHGWQSQVVGLLVVGLGCSLYGLVARWLALASLAGFDRVAGRPTRPNSPRG